MTDIHGYPQTEKVVAVVLLDNIGDDRDLRASYEEDFRKSLGERLERRLDPGGGVACNPLL